MKKLCFRMASLALAMLLLLPTLASCHGSQHRESFAVPDAFDTSRDYEITFWAKNENNPTQQSIYRKAVADFEAIYPNIKVKLKLYSDYGLIYQDVITNIATGTTPNVCITYPDHIATFMTGENVMVPLDSLMDDKQYGLGGREVRFDAPNKDEIIPKFLEEGRIGDSYYAMPYVRSTEACYVNKTYVEALGYTLPETLTWDFIWEVSEAALAKNEDGTFRVNHQKALIPFIYKSTDNMMIQALKQMGAGYSTSAGDILLFNEDTTNFLKTVATHAETYAFSTFKIDSYPGNWFNKGQCIFAIDSTAGATWIGHRAPQIDVKPEEMVDFEVEVMTVPQFDPEHPQMISQGPSMCIFNKEDPQEVLASWLFMQYMLTNEVQLAYSGTEGYVPVTEKAQASAEYADYLSREGEDNDTYYDVKIQAAKLLLENTENTFVTPVFNGSASLRNAAGQLIEEVTKGVQRKKTVDDAFIANLYESVTSLYRLDQIDRAETGEEDMGPLPTASILLLATLVTVWVGMGIYVGVDLVRKKKRENRRK